MMVYHEATGVVCPYCDVVLYQFETVIGDNAPKAGDTFLCEDCLSVGIHVTPTMIRQLTKEEADFILKDPVIIGLRLEIIADRMFPMGEHA